MSATYELPDFPVTGETITIEWSEKDQNFLIIGNTDSEEFTEDFSPVGIWKGRYAASGAGEICSFNHKVTVNENGTGTISSSLLADNSPSVNCVSGTSTFKWILDGSLVRIKITSSSVPIIGGLSQYTLELNDAQNALTLNTTNYWEGARVLLEAVYYKQ